MSSPLSPLSASSSRSESPLSDRPCAIAGAGAASSGAGSTLSLHASASAVRLTESDGMLEYHHHYHHHQQQHQQRLYQAPPSTSSSFCGGVATTTSRKQQSRQQWRRRRKRKRSRSALEDCGTAAGAEDATVASSGVGGGMGRTLLAERGRSSSSGKVVPLLIQLNINRLAILHLIPTSLPLQGSCDQTGSCEVADTCSARKALVRRRLLRLHSSTSGSLGAEGAPKRGRDGPLQLPQQHQQPQQQQQRQRRRLHRSSLDVFSQAYGGRRTVSSSSSDDSIHSTL